MGQLKLYGPPKNGNQFKKATGWEWFEPTLKINGESRTSVSAQSHSAYWGLVSKWLYDLEVKFTGVKTWEDTQVMSISGLIHRVGHLGYVSAKRKVIY